jgi:hypothetical protein
MKKLRLPSQEDSVVGVSFSQNIPGKGLVECLEFDLVEPRQTLVRLAVGAFSLNITTPVEIEVKAFRNGTILVDTVLPAGSHKIEQDLLNRPLSFASEVAEGNSDMQRQASLTGDQVHSEKFTISVAPSANTIFNSIPPSNQADVPQGPLPYVRPAVLSYQLSTANAHSVAIAQSFHRAKAPAFDPLEEVELQNGEVIRREGPDLERRCNCAE